MVHNYINMTEEKKQCAFDAQQREEMIVKHTPLVKKIAVRMAMRMPSSVQIDDLINSGCIGLINAVDRFDPKRDVNFRTYAEYRIRGSIQDELRNMDWYSRSMRKKLRDIENAVIKVEAREQRPADSLEVARELDMELEKYLKTLGQVHGAAILSIDEYIRNKNNESFSGKRFSQGVSGKSDIYGEIAKKRRIEAGGGHDYCRAFRERTADDVSVLL